MRPFAVIALAALLSACSGGVVPAYVERGAPPPPERPVARGSDERPSNDLPARQPTAATPLPPVEVPPVPTGTATAAKAGLVAGPAIDSLPITQAAAELARARRPHLLRPLFRGGSGRRRQGLRYRLLRTRNRRIARAAAGL